jgi:hypothetical protein
VSGAAIYARSIWYADGLRWIGTLLNDAAERLERNAAPWAPLEPHVYREIEDYLGEVRSRAHTQV